MGSGSNGINHGANTARSYAHPGASRVQHPSGSTLNRGRIAAALQRAPVLGAESLVTRREGRTTCRCAIAVLLSVIGVSDLTLAAIDQSSLGGPDLDAHLWKQYGGQLEQWFGFQSARQVGAVMDANDNASTEAVRERFVLNEIDRMIATGWR